MISLLPFSNSILPFQHFYILFLYFPLEAGSRRNGVFVLYCLQYANRYSYSDGKQKLARCWRAYQKIGPFTCESQSCNRITTPRTYSHQAEIQTCCCSTLEIINFMSQSWFWYRSQLSGVQKPYGYCLEYALRVSLVKLPRGMSWHLAVVGNLRLMIENFKKVWSAIESAREPHLTCTVWCFNMYILPWLPNPGSTTRCRLIFYHTMPFIDGILGGIGSRPTSQSIYARKQEEGWDSHTRRKLCAIGQRA